MEEAIVGFLSLCGVCVKFHLSLTHHVPKRKVGCVCVCVVGNWFELMGPRFVVSYWSCVEGVSLIW